MSHFWPVETPEAVFHQLQIWPEINKQKIHFPRNWENLDIKRVKRPYKHMRFLYFALECFKPSFYTLNIHLN